MRDFLNEKLNELEQSNLKRELRLLEGAQSREIVINGKRVLNFCSNDYLGLAGNLQLIQAAKESLDKEGFGSGASRLVCGNMSAHQQLEKKMAEFKKTERCCLFSCGYMANVGIISSIFTREDIIFSDKLNHASIVDGIALSRAKYKRYPHKDMDALEQMLKAAKDFRKKGIITDSVFSMDGDVAPLKEIVTLAKKYQCLVMVDEAHALGVIGQDGRGLVSHLGLEEDIDIQMGTFSKAVGSYGAYCCGSKSLVEYLINKARSFIYTTGLPPAICAASLKGIEIIESDYQRRQQLWDNTYFVRGELTSAGFNTLYSQTPILPILLKDSALAVEFSNRLFEEGIFVSAIRPPTVPTNSARLRLTLMATHSVKDVEYLVRKIKEIGKYLKVIHN
ncbi:MAG: 8-amino-7-oxononanoate synthase [Candidatus Omnitrophica bacterium]|nr:8-amino-7-oxononanoate synthase [Candidatus Omnitrophota bacterium]MCB9747317.1 8-amino-7-oxononanoate synthase [Candidatus Omnitrophota bacterium]